MSNNKQSSIEFYRLENQKLVAISMLGGMTVEEYFSSEEILYNKAKEMHKEEIEEAFSNGVDDEYEYHINNEPRKNTEQYYNETFGNEQQ